MLNVFIKKSAEELQAQLSDGRMMLLEDLVKEKTSKEAITEKAIASELKVGEWFRIDRDVIDKTKEEIHRKCNEAGVTGKALWERFEKSNKIADENPDQYLRLIETYIFEHNWDYKNEQEMRKMCKDVGKGMCDEVICDFELQMRICNGEPVDDLVIKDDKLPCVRVIELRNGGTGCFGGGANNFHYYPPANLNSYRFFPIVKYYKCTPYAFR